MGGCCIGSIDGELVDGSIMIVPLVELQKAFLPGSQVPSVFSWVYPSVSALIFV
jgi:hypothetical protein